MCYYIFALCFQDTQEAGQDTSEEDATAATRDQQIVGVSSEVVQDTAEDTAEEEEATAAIQDQQFVSISSEVVQDTTVDTAEEKELMVSQV